MRQNYFPLLHPPVSFEISISEVVKILEGGINMIKKIFKNWKTLIKVIAIATSMKFEVIDISLMPMLIT